MAEETADLTFPEADATREMNLGVPEEFPVDPISDDLATALELKEAAEARAREKAAVAPAEAEVGKREVGSTLMSALVVSGVVLAAIGVTFLVTKKLRTT